MKESKEYYQDALAKPFDYKKDEKTKIKEM